MVSVGCQEERQPAHPLFPSRPAQVLRYALSLARHQTKRRQSPRLRGIYFWRNIGRVAIQKTHMGEKSPIRSLGGESVQVGRSEQWLVPGRQVFTDFPPSQNR